MSVRTEPKLTETKVTETKLTEDKPIMATTTSTSGSSSIVATDVWTDCSPKQVTSEKMVSDAVSKKYWQKLYVAINASTADEQRKRKIRASVYAYLAVNGTSRAGDYSNMIVTADGFSYHPSEIIKACDLYNLRKWMRANANEARNFFVMTGFLNTVDMLVNKCIAAGHPTDDIIGVCDFISTAKDLTIGETALTTKLFDTGVRKARNARGGQSLESVEDRSRERVLSAQGSDENGGSIIHI